MTQALIIDVVRTASGRGKPGGALSGIHPVDLLAHVLRETVRRNDLAPDEVDDVIAGCVSQVGEQSFNTARNAVLAAGLAELVPGTTIDRQCGSSQQAVHFAAQAVAAGAYDVVIACGVESMSRVPMGSSIGGKDPFGAGVRERYPDGLVNQGVSAELVAARWKFDREALDAYAAESHRRAAEATARGAFDAEILPVPLPVHDAGQVGPREPHRSDETIRASTSPESLAALPPSFRTDALASRFPQVGWSITAGNSSPLTDGASACLIMSEDYARAHGHRARARFAGFSVTADDPLLMLTGPIPATRMVLQRTGLGIDDLDAYEVNEAFAPVPLAWAHEVGADPPRMNPNGGAIALGHALGSSGTRLLATLLHHLEATGGRYGLQTMCEGGGMANATIIERL